MLSKQLHNQISQIVQTPEPPTATLPLASPILSSSRPKHSQPPTTKIADSFVNAHYVYYTEIANTALFQASIASFCLDQCIASKANATGNVPCLSINIHLGTIYPSNPNDTAIRWLCTAFDAPSTPELYQPLEPDVDSYMHPAGVNRVCEGTFRAY